MELIYIFAAGILPARYGRPDIAPDMDLINKFPAGFLPVLLLLLATAFCECSRVNVVPDMEIFYKFSACILPLWLLLPATALCWYCLLYTSRCV